MEHKSQRESENMADKKDMGLKMAVRKVICLGHYF